MTILDLFEPVSSQAYRRDLHIPSRFDSLLKHRLLGSFNLLETLGRSQLSRREDSDLSRAQCVVQYRRAELWAKRSGERRAQEAELCSNLSASFAEQGMTHLYRLPGASFPFTISLQEAQSAASSLSAYIAAS